MRSEKGTDGRLTRISKINKNTTTFPLWGPTGRVKRGLFGANVGTFRFGHLTTLPWWAPAVIRATEDDAALAAPDEPPDCNPVVASYEFCVRREPSGTNERCVRLRTDAKAFLKLEGFLLYAFTP